MTEDLVKRVKMHEGFRPKPYYCSAGKLTLGYGWNLETTPIPERIAEEILRDQLQRRENILKSYRPRLWLQLSEARQDVLTEMAFQLGPAGVFAFKKMWAALERGDYEAAAAEMLDSKWAREDSPARAEKLAGQFKRG